MCRYAMYGPYKDHYVCFNCRKGFKQIAEADWSNQGTEYADHVFKCPECSAVMANLGLDFKVPRKNDLKAWQRVEAAYVIGHHFRTCGCNGPGFIPKNRTDHRAYLANTKTHYEERMRSAQSNPELESESRHEEVEHWRSRIELVDRELRKVASPTHGR